jgi:hypothetical protein
MTFVTFCFGQVCGLCPLGWAFVAKGCDPCPPEEQLLPLRQGVIAIFVLTCLMIWYVISWRHLFSVVASTDDLQGTVKKIKAAKKEAGGIKEKIENGIETIMALPRKLANLRKRISQVLPEGLQEQLEDLTKDRIIQYLKLYVSYFQVMSSFLTFSVKWPDLLRNSMLWVKGTLFLDVLQLPGLACLWTGISFKQRILTYTLGPLVVSLCLVMPCIFGWLAGYRTSRPQQWEAASDAAWKNIMYWVFLVYPVVSLTTLQAFDCQPQGLGLLAVDRTLKCPSGGDFLVGWSIAFIFVYPLGIPLFCWISMLGMGVHLLAQDKIDANILRNVVAKYMEVTTSIESHRIAGLFKVESADTQVDQEVVLCWTLLKEQHFRQNDVTTATIQGIDVNTICKLVRDSAKGNCHEISLEDFVSILAHEKRVAHIYNSFFDCDGKLKPEDGCIALSGVDFGSMQRFVEKYDQDGDGSISLDEFRDMVNAVIRDTSLFTGVEGDRLTKGQAIALLSFDWKSIVQRPMKAGALRESKKEDTGKPPAKRSQIETSRNMQSMISSAQNTYESAQTAAEQGQEAVDKAEAAIDKANAALDAGKKAKETSERARKMGRKALKLGGSAAKHVRCCSQKDDDDSDDDVMSKADDEVENKAEGDEGKVGDSDKKQEGGHEEKGSGKNREPKNLWKDRRFLEIACENYKDKVAAEIWKLGNTLLKNRVISVPDMVWSQVKNVEYKLPGAETLIHDELSCTETCKEFVIHPDLSDEYRQQDSMSKLFRLVSHFSTKIPDSWKSVNKRKQALEAKAMLRVGFVFSAYKVNFWFWEMIEMTRK